ncbi:MAG: hypothetical protein KC729_21865, partial [Candidatus Eisenbacteria bacterium]|nr:hypothetical protein [Candidatus Eisenbacteria bacterium]
MPGLICDESRHASRPVGAALLAALIGVLSLGPITHAETGVLTAMPADWVEPADGEVGRAVGPLAVYSDTLYFGYVGAGGYAIEGERWTWDHGGADPLEGWFSEDASAQTGTYFRRIDAGIWAGGDNGVPAPVLVGTGSAWLGLFQNEAEAECWPGGLGYGDEWCQRLQGPTLTYSGSGNVDLSFRYFADVEPNFEYV